MNANDMFPSSWLKASDIPDDDLTLTIKSLAQEEIGTDTKWVVYFEEIQKGLVLNKTNNDTIIGLHGQETDGWIGKAITLFATEVPFQGKMTMALRVRMRQPKVVSSAKSTASTKDITAYWLYAKQIGIDQVTGRHLLAECNGNFVEALKALQGDTPDTAKDTEDGIDPSDGLPFGDK